MVLYKIERDTTCDTLVLLHLWNLQYNEPGGRLRLVY